MSQYDKNKESVSEYVEGEFTLDDTYDHLKDIEKELHENMEKLMNIGNVTHSEVQTLSPHLATTPDYIQEKERRLVHGLLKHNHEHDLRIDPISNTIDVYKSAISELEQEIINVEKIFDRLKVDILNANNNIACLEREKNGLERMKETCVDAIEKNTTGCIINDGEVVDAKKLFIAVKEDLAATVDMIFPQHIEFQEILGELTSAYMKGGGDQVYVNIGGKYIDCVKFMVEANIATYHRNDKNKLRLVDLL